MADGSGVPRRMTKETSPATKTTEFRLTLAVIVLILISAFMIKAKAPHGDKFTAHQAWLYVTILAAAFAISRGFAKSGVREYPEDVDELKESRPEDRRGERGGSDDDE